MQGELTLGKRWTLVDDIIKIATEEIDNDVSRSGSDSYQRKDNINSHDNCCNGGSCSWNDGVDIDDNNNDDDGDNYSNDNVIWVDVNKTTKRDVGSDNDFKPVIL